MFSFICAALISSANAQPTETYAIAWSDSVSAFGKIDLATGSGSTAKVVFDDAAYGESSLLLQNGSVIVYSLPPYGSGYFYTLDISSPQPLNTLALFEPIGAMQCDLELGCFGHRILDDFAHGNLGARARGASDELVKVNISTGNIEKLCKLKKIIGYELGASALDSKNGLYHGVMVNKTATDGSNQWLTTVDIKKGKVVSSVPVDMSFGGPLVVDDKHGLITFGSSLGYREDRPDEKYCFMAKVNPSTGEQTCFFGEDEDFVPTVLDGAAVARGGFVLVSDIVGPYMFRLLTLDIRGDSVVIVHNVSLPSTLQNFAFDPLGKSMVV